MWLCRDWSRCCTYMSFVVLINCNDLIKLHRFSTNHNTVKINTLRQKQDGRHFPDDIFKCIFLNENVLFSIKISLKFVPKGPINNIPALVQIMAWHRPGDKPLSEAMMVSLLTHIYVTRPQWVKARTRYGHNLGSMLFSSMHTVDLGLAQYIYIIYIYIYIYTSY